jgi:hypothetical protein
VKMVSMYYNFPYVILAVNVRVNLVLVYVKWVLYNNITLYI